MPTTKPLDRAEQLRLIYRWTHRDYKGKIDGARSILINRNGAACLVLLANLTDAEIAEQLPYALKREQEHKAIKV